MKVLPKLLWAALLCGIETASSQTTNELQQMLGTTNQVVVVTNGANFSGTNWPKWVYIHDRENRRHFLLEHGETVAEIRTDGRLVGLPEKVDILTNLYYSGRAQIASNQWIALPLPEKKKSVLADEHPAGSR